MSRQNFHAESAPIASPEVPTERPPSSVARKRHWYEGVLKRGMDIIGSGILLAAFSPLLLMLAVLIRVIDGSPIIHRRRVIGPNGGFDAFKLRTMIQNADAILAADAGL